ncbi:MAG: strawberry notch family protein, partial [Synergistaceae bacterium]|nr:strawberry notch family protein [Synergistaceae bacterium]
EEIRAEEEAKAANAAEAENPAPINEPEAQSVKTQEQEAPSKPESKPEPNQEQDVKAAAIAEIKKEQTKKAEAKTAEQPARSFDYNGSKIEYSVSSDGTNRYIVLSDGERIGIYNPASNRFTYQGAANDWTKQEKAKFSKQFKEHYNNFLQTAAPKPEEDSKDAIDSEAAAQDTDQTIEAQASEIADKETSEQPMDADKAAAKKSASIRLADWVKRRLTIGTFAPITNSQLIEMAEKEFGGSLAKGTFNMKDVYDAMEMGVNKAIQALKINPRLAANPSVVLTHLNKLNEIMGCLPTQQTNTRTAEQNEFQQFSTPPHIAYVANWLANISKNDTVLEPSAGVGGLAVFAKNAGATVVMNELSDRRAGLLDEMNLGHVFRVNAEHINDMLPDDVKPTRIVMNPPFSSTAGRISGQRKTSNAYAHVEQALLRLEDGGRLVAILGKGMNDDAPAHREWWNRIKSKYNVRANVILDGTEYSKYGTSFGNVIVVIDKSGPTPENGTVTGNYKKLPDMIVSLLDVRNSVPDTAVKQRTQDKTKSEAAEPSEPEVKSESAAKPKAKAVKSEAVKTEQKPEIQPEQDIKEPEAQPEKPVAEIKTENKTEAEQQEERKANKNDDVNYVYDNYRPSKLKIAGAKHHPADLVESAAMGSITMPDITYKPHLDSKIITQGLLSDAQLEAVVYAGQAFTVMNNDGTRRGFFIGDGTGLGKGREIAGVITDQMNQGHGKGKAVWISMKHNLISDAKRDYAGIGNNPDDIFSQQNIKGDIENSKGILFTAYSMIRNEKRLEQLKKWLDEDFDGVIALDEVHNANNAVDSQGGRGRTKASQQGLAVGDLVKAFPKARILYVSATGATEVKNLAMLDRLGLWGAGTQFANKQDFINEIEAGGKSAMEVVARDLKAMGLYVARSISKRAGPYGGSENVTFSRLTHSLTGEQTAIYNKIAEGWQIVLKNIDEALKLCGANEKNKPHAASAALSKFYSLQQKCFNQIITALQTPAVIEDIKKQLANGNSVIIQLTNTDEAALKAAIAGLKEDETLEDLDITPKDALINFLKTSFPVTLLEEYEDENHNIRMRQVLDRDGNPVISKEAVKLRDRLIDDINSIRFPQSPLDMIINEFGTKQVAEITGRTQRVVRDETGKLVREKLSPKAREADKTAFNEGRKRILIFSEAGGTGASYHASLDFKNQQKRIHYLLQAGWKADTAVQGLGRGDRSNQAHRAHYVLVETDVPGQKRFISTIARRLEQLGALTTGERKTATQGLFSESDNLESIYAKDALDKLFVALKYGRYNDINSYEVMRDMGYKSYFDKDKKDNAPPITQFLNRILALDIDTQKKLFKHFEDLIEANVAMAIERGTFDAGTETIRADKINIKQEHTVYKDKTNGIETKYIKLEVMNKQKPVSMAVAKVQGFTSFYKNREGNVVAAKLTKGNGTDLSTGAIKPKYLLKSPDPSYRATTTRLDNPEYYMPLSEEEASQLWGEQSLAVPEFKVTEKHMITGALMPIWKSLDGSPQIQRVMTDDGRTFLGRIIPQTLLKNTLVKLGAKDQLAKVTPQELLKRLEKQGASANLSNGWVLKTVRVNGGKRIEILYANFYYKNQLEQQGAIVEEQYNSGRRVFIPEGNETLLQQILDAYEVIGFNDDIALEGEETINANIPDSALDTNLYFIHPEIRKWMEIFNMTARPAYGADNPAAPFIETSANKSNYEFEDKAMEDLYQADKNIRPQSAMGKIAHFVNQVIKPFTSDYPELEGDDAFIPVKEDLRKLKREMLASSQEIVNKLRYIVEDMKPDDYDLFNRVVVLRDYQETKQLNPEAQLPEGYTIESVDKELDRMNEKVQKNKLVSRAIARAEEIEREIVRELIEAAKELDWDIEDKFKRQHYFRHTVIEYIDAAKSGASQGLKAPDNRGYMRQRKGSDKAIITDYIRAMGEVWSRMQGDIKITKVLAKIRDKFDIADELKREAFIKNEQKTMVHLAEQLGNMDEAQKYVKRELNKTQAAALTRLFNLARDNKLPTGGNKEFASVAELMAKTGQIELLSDKDRKRFNKYLSWLAGLEETDSGRQAARWYFSGVKKKQKAVKNMLGKEYLTFQDLIPDNYDAYDPFSNRLVFSVNTVPEYLMKLAEDSIDQMLHIPLHDITRALVMGGHRQLWVIPKALADTLNNIAKSMPQGMLSTYANEATGWWKNYVLTTPFRGRIWKYNLRNFLGDAESILQANPGAVKYFWQALKELFDVFYYNKQATGLLAEFQKRGGGLTTESVQELRTWENMKEFEHLINKQGHINPFTLPITAVKQYWTLASKITNFRETWLRYADFISRVNQIQENYERHGTMRPTSYGFSKKAEVLAHDNIYDMAFKLSNEDLGAYDQVSEAMQHLRKFWLPFGSFQELVIRRNIQGLKNIWQGGSWGEYWLTRKAEDFMKKFNKVYGDGSVPPKIPNNNQTGGASDSGDNQHDFNLLFKSLGRHAKYPIFVLRAILTMAMLSPLMLGFHIINRIFMRKFDDDLTPDERAQPHITLGRNPWTGNVIYFNRIGSGFDFLDILGLDTIFKDVKDIRDGHMTFWDLFKQITAAPLNKAINTLTPFIKTPVEATVGRSLYPDFRHPRIIKDMGAYLASTVNLDWWYKAITGKPHEPFFDVVGSVAYQQNPIEASYYYILASKRQFQENVLGKKFDGYATTRRGEALNNFRAALKYNDKNKAIKYLTEYVELGGTQEGLESSTNAMHPLAGLNKLERAQFIKWLRPDEHKVLGKALDYYIELARSLGVKPKL